MSASAPEKQERKTSIPTFARGAIGGTAAAFSLQPLDVLKSRQQYEAAINGEHRTMRQLFTGIVRTEGVHSLWNGGVPTVLRVSIGVGIYFTTLDLIVRSGMDAAGKSKETHPTAAAAAGAVARSVSCTAMHPVSVVKARMESYTSYKPTGVWCALKDIARNEKLAGLYSGLGAALLRDVPYSAAYVSCYQQILVLGDTLGFEATRGTRTFTAGLSAGMIATFLTHPFDVVKTRLQLNRIKSGPLTPTSRIFGLFSVFGQIYKSEGVRGIFRGVTLRLLKRPLSSAVVWTTFEIAGAAETSGMNAKLRKF